MRNALIVAGLVISLSAQAQDIYKWVDQDGVVHYSDQPGSPDAERVEIAGWSPQPQEEAQAPALYESEPAEEAQPSAGPTYQLLRIASPAEDEVFYGGDVSVAVQLELDRDLRPGDTIALTVDGRPVPEAQGLTASLTGLLRGSHTLRASVLDADGSTVISSAPVTFHLRQPSIATPPTGPKVDPRPRPPTAPPRPTPLPGR